MGRSMVSTIESGHSSLDTARLLGLQEHGVDLNFLVSGKRPIEAAAESTDWQFVVLAIEQIKRSAQKNSVELPPEKTATILKNVMQMAAAGQNAHDCINELVLLAA